MSIISGFLSGGLYPLYYIHHGVESLKSIREDEEVSQHHGNNVLVHKAISLGLGASIAAIGGIYYGHG